ncbi:hypothetical protein ACTFIZ_007546 [Dictyostelium cf. discoideum]
MGFTAIAKHRHKDVTLYRQGCGKKSGDVGNISIYDVDFEALPNVNMQPSGYGLFEIDHVIHNVHRGRMKEWASFYERLFNFKEIRYFDIEGQVTGVKSKAMTSPCGKIQYLDMYHGEGIQHNALASTDLYHTVDELRAHQIQLLDTIDTYYELVDRRIPNHGEKVEDLKKRKILIDGKPDDLLLQIFSENQIGPIFFEFIQRKGNQGFGEVSLSGKITTSTKSQSNSFPANLPPNSPPNQTIFNDKNIQINRSCKRINQTSLTKSPSSSWKTPTIEAFNLKKYGNALMEEQIENNLTDSMEQQSSIASLTRRTILQGQNAYEKELEEDRFILATTAWHFQSNNLNISPIQPSSDEDNIPNHSDFNTLPNNLGIDNDDSNSFDIVVNINNSLSPNGTSTQNLSDLIPESQLTTNSTTLVNQTSFFLDESTPTNSLGLNENGKRPRE